jgi:hypothetical protein
MQPARHSNVQSLSPGMEDIVSLEQDLLAIEDDFWTGGPEAYRRHADENCLVAFSEFAGVMSNDDIAKAAAKGRWSEVSLKPKGIARLSDTSAVITYECNAKRQDGHPYHALVSSGYAKRSDGWKLAFHQQTSLP